MGGVYVCVCTSSYIIIYTHTHTHTERERERSVKRCSGVGRKIEDAAVKKRGIYVGEMYVKEEVYGCVENVAV